jgi:glycosyltransferase involved in cell wall biosynthesis
MDFKIIKKRDYVFVTRLFSGMFETIESKKWSPTGIPTIAKLVKKLAEDHHVKWLLICKTKRESTIIGHKKQEFKLNNIDFIIQPYIDLPFPMRKAYSTLDAIRVFTKYAGLFIKQQNSIYYLDRSNVILAFLIKKIFRPIVVLRILGVYPSQKKITKGLIYNIKTPITYFAYKTKFDLCIGTQDGSGTEFYLPELVNASTQIEVLINGVDLTFSNNENLINERLEILFVGSFTNAKGIMEFIAAANQLQRYNDKLQFNIVGKGFLCKEMMEMIKQYNLEDFVSVLGSLNKNQLSDLYKHSDIYVSLNKLGNLSNTVLEALAAGMCVMILEKDLDKHIDEFTDEFVGTEIAIRLSRDNTVNDFVMAIEHLVDNTEEIISYSRNALNFARNNFWSWEERINYEIELLKRIQTKNSKIQKKSYT